MNDTDPVPSAPAPDPSAPLRADGEEIARFVDALFRYVSPGTFVSLRSFYHDPRRPPADIRSVKLDADEVGLAPLVRAAAHRASYAANLAEPAVFAPPLCTFKSRRSAAGSNLADGLALSVECDAAPEQARGRLEMLLGPATVAVASGGQWTDTESGEVQDKLHLHWRLAVPTRAAADHARLHHARRLAALFADGDLSAAPIVHPMRWPGSWHRKGEPRLARIVELRPDREVALDDAVAVLEDAVALAGLTTGQPASPGATARHGAAGDEDLQALADAIPNPDLPWDEWNRIGMAFWAASEGDEAGLAAFASWSGRSGKDDPGITRARWEHYRGSPPGRLTIGTLVHRARQASPGFRLPSWQRARDAPVEDAPRASAATAPPGDGLGDRDDDPRVKLKLGAEWINETTRGCARLLDDTLFMRGSIPAMLVQVEDLPEGKDGGVDDTEPGITLNGVRHAAGSLVFAEPSPERIQYRLDEQVRFERLDRRSGEWVPASCPTGIARRIIGAASDLHVRPCAGVICVPLFHRGKVIVMEGYQAQYGVYLDPPVDLPPVPHRPTKADAHAALEVLLAPFRGYLKRPDPAEARRLRTAFAGAGMTAVLRPSLAAAPAILLDANVAGAGKGKAARALAVLASGRLPAVITEGHAPEETEKRLAAAILSGAPAILLDNLQRTLASSTLESGLTEGTATIRLFGKLTDVTVPVSALVLVTANNASLRADMLRRTLPVRIVADTDQPERRRFTFDPYEEARRRRPEMIAAALTIARAWWLARDTEDGCRIRNTTLGSFEDWADQVAGPVAWLTGMSPIELIEERKAEDPGRAAEGRVIAALRAAFGDSEWTARAAVGQPDDMAKPATGIDPEAWAPVMSFKGDRPTAHQVGLWLSKRKDKVFSELQLANRIDRNGIALWQVRGMRGVAGDTCYQPRKDGGSFLVGGSGNDGWGEESDIIAGAGGTIPRDPPHPPQAAAEEFDL